MLPLHGITLTCTKGKISFTDESTINIIEQITGKYETGQSAAAFKNLPGEYVDRLVKANHWFYN